VIAEWEQSEAVVHWAQVVGSGLVAGDYFELWLSSPEIARNVRAGQFVEIRCTDNTSPLLPRPMSVEWAEPEHGRIRVLVRRMGKGTAWLCNRRVGDEVFVYGPLGRPWRALPEGGGRMILVGGGAGVAPLLCLAKEIAESGRSVQTVALIGASSGGQILREGEFKTLGIETQIATDDGSQGFHGTVADLFDDYITRNEAIAVYACGPNPMMRRVTETSIARGIRCDISLETFMACGYGVCLGCIVKDVNGRSLRACVEGPCISASDVDWGSIGES
jgi:dihydroorotate dehydrogenase electron transfer subunit